MKSVFLLKLKVNLLFLYTFNERAKVILNTFRWCIKWFEVTEVDKIFHLLVHVILMLQFKIKNMKILCVGEALIDMICTDIGKKLTEGQNFLKK